MANPAQNFAALYRYLMDKIYCELRFLGMTGKMGEPTESLVQVLMGRYTTWKVSTEIVHESKLDTRRRFPNPFPNRVTCALQQLRF